MKTFGRQARSILAFFLVPALSILSSTLLLPLITRSFGPSGLSSLAVGSGIGALTSVAVGLVWPLTGGFLVGSADDENARRELYADSIASRTISALVLLPLALPVTIAVSHGHALATCMFMVAVASNGFTASWYFAGCGTALGLVRNEALPRVASYVVAAFMMGALGAPLWTYGLSMMLAAGVSFSLNWRSAMPSGKRPTWARGWAIARQQARGTGARVFQCSFTYLRAPIFASVADVGLASFSASEQIQGAAANAAAALPAGLTRFVSSNPTSARRRTAYLVCCAAALLGFGAWMFVAPTLVAWLFASQVSFSRPEYLAIGGAIALTFMLRCFEQLVMVPAGLSRLVYENNVLVSAFGVVLLVTASATSGLSGGIYCVAFTAAIGHLHYAARLAVRRSTSEAGTLVAADVPKSATQGRFL